MRQYIKHNGLTYNFRLTGGKFTFTQGAEKKRMDLLFFMRFDFTPRIYRPEFIPNLSWVIQKPMAYIRGIQGLLLGNLKGKILYFIDGITIQNMGIGKDRFNKTYFLAMDYAYQSDVNEEIVEFVTVI